MHMSCPSHLIFPLPGLLFALILSGCGEPSPPSNPVEEKFKDFYAAEMVEREISRLKAEDQARLEKRLDSLRIVFGFSAAETDSLLTAMRDTLPRWEAFLDDVLKRVGERERRLTPDDRPPPGDRPRPVL